MGIDPGNLLVLDIHTNSQNPIIGDRAFGTTAEVVASFGAALIRQLHASGVVACGKHFPGHGDTSTDSHLELPLVEHPPDRLDAVEFVPFRAGIAAGLATIMTAHVLVPALDPDLPATLSRKVVDGVLKKAMGFEGLVISDDLGMKAVAEAWPLPEAMVASLRAGCDAVLLCNSTQDEQVEAFEAVIHALEDGSTGCRKMNELTATVATRPWARRDAGIAPATSTCDMIQPPKMSPWKFASAGIGTTRRTGIAAGSSTIASIAIPYAALAPLRASSRNSRRRILPTFVLGNSVRNSTSRGHL
jgi:hypothetical protein